MTNFVGLVSGLGNGRALDLTSTGRLFGIWTAWLEEAMMTISFREKEISTLFGGEKKAKVQLIMSLADEVNMMNLEGLLPCLFHRCKGRTFA